MMPSRTDRDLHRGSHVFCRRSSDSGPILFLSNLPQTLHINIHLLTPSLPTTYNNFSKYQTKSLHDIVPSVHSIVKTPPLGHTAQHRNSRGTRHARRTATRPHRRSSPHPAPPPHASWLRPLRPPAPPPRLPQPRPQPARPLQEHRRLLPRSLPPLDPHF